VALARALVLNPQMLLLDEPLSNLDAKIRVQVRSEIRKLQKELGITRSTSPTTRRRRWPCRIASRSSTSDESVSGASQGAVRAPRNRFVADFIASTTSSKARCGRPKAPPCGGNGVRRAFGNPRCHAAGRGPLRDLRSAGEHRAEQPIRRREESIQGTDILCSYLGNTLRYDVDLGGGVTFKTDVGDPWDHEQIPMGTTVELSCAIGSTLAIPAD